MARLSVDALAERAQVNPRFIERLEGAQAVQDGPALLAVFDALAHACERLRDDAEGARAAFVQWRNERMDRTRATEDEIYSVRTGTPPDPCPLGPGECDSTDTDVITGG
jgi:hypothetical protein